MVVVLWFEITNNIGTCVLCHILNRIDISYTFSYLIIFQDLDFISFSIQRNLSKNMIKFFTATSNIKHFEKIALFGP